MKYDYSWSEKIAFGGNPTNSNDTFDLHQKEFEKKGSGQPVMVKGVRINWAELWEGATSVIGFTLYFDDKTSYTCGTQDTKNSHFNEVFLKDNEYINKIEYKAGDLVDSITFHTNLRRQIGPYGGKGGSYGEFHPKAPECFLSGVKGVHITVCDVKVLRYVQFCWGHKTEN